MPYTSRDEKLCYSLGLEDMLRVVGMDNPTHTLDRDLYRYIHYNDPDEDELGAIRDGNERGYYAWRILTAIHILFDDITFEEIQFRIDSSVMLMDSAKLAELIFEFVSNNTSSEELLNSLEDEFKEYSDESLATDVSKLLIACGITDCSVI